MDDYYVEKNLVEKSGGDEEEVSRGDVVISTTRIGVSFNSFVTEQRGRVHEVPAACEFRQIGGNTKTTFFTQNNFRMYLTYQWGLRPVLFTIGDERIGQ